MANVDTNEAYLVSGDGVTPATQEELFCAFVLAARANGRIPNTIEARGKRLVCRIYDAGDVPFDRYTIAFKGYTCNGKKYYPFLASSCNPFDPQGLGSHEESEHMVTGRELGKRVRFESLPLPVQKFILQSI